MIEVLEFIFQDFWHWFGAYLLIHAVFGEGIVRIVRYYTDRKDK